MDAVKSASARAKVTELVSLTKETREIKGLGQLEASVSAGLDKATVSRWERNLFGPSLWTFIMYLDVLDLEIVIRTKGSQ